MAKKTKQELKDADIATLTNQLKNLHIEVNQLNTNKSVLIDKKMEEIEQLELRLQAMEGLKIK